MEVEGEYFFDSSENVENSTIIVDGETVQTYGYDNGLYQDNTGSTFSAIISCAIAVLLIVLVIVIIIRNKKKAKEYEGEDEKASSVVSTVGKNKRERENKSYDSAPGPHTPIYEYERFYTVKICPYCEAENAVNTEVCCVCNEYIQ